MISINKPKFHLYENLLLIPLHHLTTVSVGIFIKAGSSNEQQNFGLAHFLEHMTFKGTVDKPDGQILKQLDSIGAIYNALTAHEFTLYYISGDPKDVFILLDILIDLLNKPAINISDIEKERTVILDECDMDEDNSYRKLSQTMYSLAYKKTPLARPIIGYKSTINKIDKKSIVEFRNTYYVSPILVITGNFDKTNVLSFLHIKLKKDFVEKNIGTTQLLYQKHVNFINSRERIVHINKATNQTIIYVMFGTFNNNSINKYIIDLICDILSNGFSSRLFTLLRTKLGVSYNINAINRTFSNAGNIIISITVDPKNVFLTLQNLLHELKQIRNIGFLNEEVNIAKKQNKTSLLFEFKDSYEYLFYYGFQHLYNLPLFTINETFDLIDSITTDKINEIAKIIFVKNNIMIGTIGKQYDLYIIQRLLQQF